MNKLVVIFLITTSLCFSSSYVGSIGVLYNKYSSVSILLEGEILSQTKENIGLWGGIGLVSQDNDLGFEIRGWGEKAISQFGLNIGAGYKFIENNKNTGLFFAKLYDSRTEKLDLIYNLSIEKERKKTRSFIGLGVSFELFPLKLLCSFELGSMTRYEGAIEYKIR